MPRNNAFRHQRYSAEVPATVWHLLRPTAPPEPGSAEYEPLMASVGQAYRAAGVRAIYLVHGTFAGDDAIGFTRIVESAAPAWARRLRHVNKQLLDKLAKDCGNYLSQYADQFHRSCGVPVERVLWSGENHHLARAHTAVCLIDRLAEAGWGPEDRVLLWGHSHAGNVFALLTNLLTADATQRASFFEAGRCFYRQAWLGGISKPVWERVRDWLDAPPASRRMPSLDLVTMGTPIRYGWDTDGYARLLHFIYHRPRQNLPEYRTVLPRSIADLLHASGGDYIQQLGIAGTNLVPLGIGLPSWLADLRLNRLVQPGLLRRDLLSRLRMGQRVPAEGETLLVEYPDSPGTRPLFGHAIYTRLSWLAFHATEVARRFYGGTGSAAEESRPVGP